MPPEEKSAPETAGSVVRTLLAPTWIDFEASGDAAKVALRAENLPPSLIEAALAHGSLPKFESDGGATLWLFRGFDDEADLRAASARDLTRKFALFMRPEGMITCHRYHLDRLAEAVAHPDDPACIAAAVLDRVTASYVAAISKSEDTFDELEASVFHAKGSRPFRLKEAYFLKRRLNIIRKMLLLTIDTIDAALAEPAFAKMALRQYRRKCAIGARACETLLESVTHVLDLHMEILSQITNEESQRTNEIMRVLTVFSAFFLPLSFVAGVYGMNFKFMPELEHRHGYPVTLAFMGFVSLVIWLWFKRKGWIGSKPAKAVEAWRMRL